MALVTMGQTEEFGPAKAVKEVPTEARPALDHLPGRVYALRKTWSGFGSDQDEALLAFEGDAATLNAALAVFARLPGAKEIRLLPGPGHVHSVTRDRSCDCDWHVHLTSRVIWPRDNNPQTESHTAILTIYIARADKTPPLDPRAADWIEHLDHERFATRQRAYEQLSALEDAAARLLQTALAAREVSAERRARIENLLRRIQPIHPAQLRLPAGVPVLGADDLFDRESKNWRSKDLGTSWTAAGQIAALAESSEPWMPLLVEMLHDRREQVRDLAVDALKNLGPRATILLGSLQAERTKARADCRVAFERAVSIVGSVASADPDHAWSESRRVGEGIRHFLKSASS